MHTRVTVQPRRPIALALTALTPCPSSAESPLFHWTNLRSISSVLLGMAATHVRHHAFGQDFILDQAYSDIRPLGVGAYGDVVKARRISERTGGEEWHAIKRVKGISTKK